MSEPFLKLAGITKKFGPTTALDGVDLEVGADELVVVLGPTGAGKTTLLRVAAGLETPEQGQVLIAGRDVGAEPPAARDVAMVFQNFSLYPDWTVRRNLEFPLRAPGRQLSREEITERVEWAAALLKIEPLLERQSHQLSGGEMQRVAIGRAIVRRPRLFLLDEPLSNLDAKLREALRVELVCLRRELGAPMLFVTHDQAEALSMADRIVVLAEGRALQRGLPEEVYRQPASPVVGRLLGRPPINVFAVKRQGDDWANPDGVPLAPATGERADTMLLGVRPENLLADGGQTTGSVQLVEDKGAYKILLVDWAATSVHLIVPRDAPYRVGDEVRPRIDAEHMVLWPSTG